MRSQVPLIFKLSLNLVGVFSLVLTTNLAQAQAIPDGQEACPACDSDESVAQLPGANKPAPIKVVATDQARSTATANSDRANPPVHGQTQPALPAAKSTAPQTIAATVTQAPVARNDQANDQVPQAVATALAAARAEPPQQTAAPPAPSPPQDLSHVPASQPQAVATQAAPAAEPANHQADDVVPPAVTAAITEAKTPTAEHPSEPAQPPVTTTPKNSTSPPQAAVSLPSFVESRTPPKRAAAVAAQPQPRAGRRAASPSPTVTPTRSAPRATATPRKPINLPRLAAPAAPPAPPATDVMAVWNRVGPKPAPPTIHDWSQGLPPEAMPATTVQAPAGQIAQTLPDDLAQANTPAADVTREDLLITPLASDPVATVRYPPSPNAGIPSAFGAEWGDFFVSVTGAGADRLRNEIDGSISAGFGVGNPRTAVGVELAYNLLSIRNFGENGSFDAKVHREVFSNPTTQAAVAVGWSNFANYGDNVAGTESSVYGAVSAAHLLQPDNPVNRLPITGTLGIGGGTFSDDGSDVGVFAGIGLQVDPQLSLNAAWSGVGINVGASVVPFPEIPLTLNAIYGDITNNTEAGSVATFTIGYGFNFGPRF